MNPFRHWIAALPMLLACEGTVEGPTGSTPETNPSSPVAPSNPVVEGTVDEVCVSPTPTVSSRPVRRLTPTEVQNTWRDLTGDAEFVSTFDDEETVLTERGARQLNNQAEALVGRQDRWTVNPFDCDGSACLGDLVDGFARRVLRHPPSAEERAWIQGVYDRSTEALSPREGLEVTGEVLLQSPQMLYLQEVGSDPVGNGVFRLTDHELAARLSYFLWQTLPDAELDRAADAGELSDAAGLRAQAERMLTDPRAEPAVLRFFSEWLQLDGGRLHHALEDVAKDATLYPEFSAELLAAMRVELEAFVRRRFFEGDSSFADVWLSRDAYVGRLTAELYGVPGVTDERWVQLDSEERAGLVTRAGFLTVFSDQKVQSPIRRGVFVFEELFCTPLGEPPADVNNVSIEDSVPDTGEPRTVRELVEVRTAGAECQGCHSIINPIGYTLESYDALGRFRTSEVESGLAIDDSGALPGTDVDGTVEGGVALSEALASSDRVRDCFARRWFEQAIGGAALEADSCSLATVRQRFEETGSMRELLLAIVESDAFRHLAH